MTPLLYYIDIDCYDTSIITEIILRNIYYNNDLDSDIIDLMKKVFGNDYNIEDIAIIGKIIRDNLILANKLYNMTPLLYYIDIDGYDSSIITEFILQNIDNDNDVNLILSIDTKYYHIASKRINTYLFNTRYSHVQQSLEFVAIDNTMIIDKLLESKVLRTKGLTYYKAKVNNLQPISSLILTLYFTPNIGYVTLYKLLIDLLLEPIWNKLIDECNSNHNLAIMFFNYIEKLNITIDKRFIKNKDTIIKLYNIVNYDTFIKNNLSSKDRIHILNIINSLNNSTVKIYDAEQLHNLYKLYFKLNQFHYLLPI